MSSRRRSKHKRCVALNGTLSFFSLFFVLSLLGAVISLYLTYSWYTEGFCSECAYEHAVSDGNRFWLQIMEHYYSTIHGAPVALLSLVVFTIASLLGLAALTWRVGLRSLTTIVPTVLLASLVYGSYLQYVALFVIGNFYPLYTLLYLDLVAVSVVSVKICFTTGRRA